MRDDDEEQKWTRQIKKRTHCATCGLARVGWSLFPRFDLHKSHCFLFPFIYFPSFFLIFSPAKIIEAKMVADSKGKSDISFAGTYACSAFAACFAEVTIHELVPISLLLMIMLLSCWFNHVFLFKRFWHLS